MKYVLDNIENIIEEVKLLGNGKNDYLKIFFDADKDEYKKEYMRYTYPKIFNSNRYNVEIGDGVFGLSNDNMGMNDKKPYLELKGTKFKVPFRISLEDAITSKRLFEWLGSLQDEKGRMIRTIYIPIDFDFKSKMETVEGRIEEEPFIYIYQEQSNGRVVIKDFEVLNKLPKIENFCEENYLGMVKFEEKPITNLKQLEERIDRYYYSNKLRWNYYTDKVDTSIGEFSTRQVNILLTTRQAMLDYFKKGKDKAFLDCIEKITLDLTIDKFNSSKENTIYDIERAVNFRLNLFKYFDRGVKKDMGDRIIELQNKILIKADSDDTAYCSNDEEFYFAAGQVARYIVSQSEAKNKTHSFFEPFITAKNAKILKQKLNNTYETYNHAINFKYKKFNNLYGMVMGYETNSKVTDYIDIFLAGACSRNILFNKKEEVENGEEE